MEQAIQKAIEGGWRSEWKINRDVFNEYGQCIAIRQDAELSKSDILLDPLFWQTLGKSLGWENPPKEGYISYGKATGEDYWKYQMHRFIDHLIANKPPELFFEKLIK